MAKVKTVFFLIFLFGLACLPLMFTTSLLFLKDPPVWPDEAIFMDMANSLASSGRLATNLFAEAIPGLSQASNWYPPLYFYLLAFWNQMFGSTIEASRSLSLVLGLTSLALFFLTARWLFRSSLLAFFGTLLLSTDFWFSRVARVARMDMLTFFFLQAALGLFVIARKTRRFPKYFYLAAGILSGLALLTHPFGLLPLVIMVGFVLLSQAPAKNKLLTIIYIAGPALFFASVWLFSLRNSFELFLGQYQLQFARKADDLPFVFQLITSDASWLLIYLSYLAAGVALAYCWRRGEDNLLLILIGLVVSLGAIIWGKEMWYGLYFQPFISLAFLAVISGLPALPKFGLRQIILVSALVVLGANTSLSLRTIAAVGSPDFNYHNFTALISAQLPEGASIFLANIPDPYPDLRHNQQFTFYEFPTVPVSPEKYSQLLLKADYMVVNYVPDRFLAAYIQKYTRKQIKVAQPGGYTTHIIELVPQPDRY